MRIGMVGLGKMGSSMSLRLLRGGHEVVGYDVDPAAAEPVRAEGAAVATSLTDLVGRLDPPRVVWLMLPAGAVTEETISTVVGQMSPGDTIVDGGNSRYRETVERAAELATAEISLVDAGTSGGVWGVTEGYCLMVGADADAFDHLEPIFQTLAPEGGYAHVGPPGSGHFVKMVHNGIEYALMQGYAEGFELLRNSGLELDAARIAELWRHGSVVRSWLLDLLARALEQDPELATVSDYVEDSGEGRWTVETAIQNAVPTPTIALALFERFASRQGESFSGKVLAALRREFGGHGVRRGDEEPR